MNDKEKLSLKYKISTVFSPTSPINQYELFAGRISQINKIFTAVGQRGEHAIVYGERAVGKTSLANVLAEFLAGALSETFNLAKVNCDAKDNFTILWRRIFRELKVTVQKAGVGFKSGDSTETVSLMEMADKKISPDDVRYFLNQLPGTTIIIIDELDRIKDSDTTIQLADTIKALSDHSVNSTLVLVGVADSVGEIIADHKSIARALIQIPMPPMSPHELGEILTKGLGQIGMTIREEAKTHITKLSQGLPHYTHLLGLLSAQKAVDYDRREIYMSDVQEAIKDALAKTNQSNVQNYSKATYSSHKDSLYDRVLLACALTPSDSLGYFAAADVRDPLSKIMGRPYDIPAFARHLNDFCESRRGSVLKRSGESRRFRYKFDDPQMRPFVTMNGLAKGLITEEAWRELTEKQISDERQSPPRLAL